MVSILRLILGLVFLNIGVNVHKNFDLDFKDGDIGEKLVESILKGKMEVKRDFRCHITGNIPIEVSYKGSPSGLSTTEARNWAFVLNHSRTIVIVPTNKLKRIIANKDTIRGGDNNLSEMVLLKVTDIVMLNGIN